MLMGLLSTIDFSIFLTASMCSFVVGLTVIQMGELGSSFSPDVGLVAGFLGFCFNPVYCRYWLSSFVDAMGTIDNASLSFVLQVFFFSPV
jgi:hypothetical protein